MARIANSSDRRSWGAMAAAGGGLGPIAIMLGILLRSWRLTFAPEIGDSPVSLDQMVKLHGDDAELAAAARAETMLGQGSVDGFHVWKRVVYVIRGLQRNKPDPDETLI
jgi:hypothetical protein